MQNTNTTTSRVVLQCQSTCILHIACLLLLAGQIVAADIPEPEWQEVLPGDIQPVWSIEENKFFQQWSTTKGKQELQELLRNQDSFLSAHALLVALHRPLRDSHAGRDALSSSKRVGMNFEVNYDGVRFSIVRTEGSGFITQKIIINNIESQMAETERNWRDRLELLEGQDTERTFEHNRTSEVMWKKLFANVSAPLNLDAASNLNLKIRDEITWFPAGIGLLRPRLSDRLLSRIESSERDVLLNTYFRGVWSDVPEQVVDAHILLSVRYCPSSIVTEVSVDGEVLLVRVRLNGIMSKPIKYTDSDGNVVVFDENPREISQIRCFWAAVFDDVLPGWPEKSDEIKGVRP